MIQNGKVVTVQYSLNVVNADKTEDLVEQTSAENPLVFLFGAGRLIPLFEENLAGKQSGDAFDFHVPAEEGYGLHQSDQIAALPKDIFKGEEGVIDEEIIQIGMMVPMMDDQGNQHTGLILEIHEEHILMDFNHPMAGKDLHFVGTVTDVREASTEELEHNHVHGEGGHHH